MNTIIFSERPPTIDKLLNLDEEFNLSLINLAFVLEKNRYLFEDIVNLMDSNYKPNLLALKLSKINEHYFLFTHALFDIVIFASILNVLEIPFDMNSIQSFNDSINIINRLVSLLLIKHEYHLIYKLFNNFVWNRELNLATLRFLRKHHIHLIHGHLGEMEFSDARAKYHTNLDTNIGRPVSSPEENKGRMKLFFHQETVESSNSNRQCNPNG